jgi:rare lipoprotein A
VRLSLYLIGLASLLVACSNQKPFISDSAPAVHPTDIEQTPDAIPRIEAKSRGGNPASYEVFGKTYHVLPSNEGFVQRGHASWYGTKFHGNKTSNGEVYDMYAMTAAHKTLPLPSYVEVKNLSSGKKIVVRVNDRGPFHDGRIIDLSYAAAAKLGTLKNGTSLVEIRVINPRLKHASALDTPPYSLHKKRKNIAVRSAEKPGKTEIKKTGYLFLQIGAFRSLNNATKLKSQLETELGNLVSIKTQASSALFLVHAGPFIDVSAANLARTKLQKMGLAGVLHVTKF